MSLAYRMSLIKESPTLAVSAKATRMKKDGLDVVALSAGEPDFDTPTHIKDAAIRAINAGKTKYTPSGGTIELKEAIVNKFKRENNLVFTSSQVIASAGGKHSIFNALQAILSESDEIIIPAPYWVSYPDMTLLCSGTPVIVTCNRQENYKLTADKLKLAITAKTKVVFLNSPSNPTGMVYTAEELRALADVLINYPHVYIITDDIYEHILFEDIPFINILNVAPELYKQVIVINGVSKAYAMTGWRIGYAACGDATIIKAMDIIQSQSTSNPCSIAQAAAVEALNGGLDALVPMRLAFIERHQHVIKRLNQINGIKALPAQGAFYSFFDCENAIENMYNKGRIIEKTDLALANYLLDKFLVATVPGSAFGLDNHIRISFATSMKEIDKALDRIQNALE